MKPKDLERTIKFRREVHQHPESGFKEFETRDRIKSILKQFGVDDKQMKQIEPTALIVNISGKGQVQGQKKCVAFRADMDALTMQQTNSNLEYASKNPGTAHMCGHDGHMACLIGFVPLFMSARDKVPSNKTVRLLFQPSEEGPESGAKHIIEKGCLEGVDQVYGFHNWPTAEVGELWCKQGPVMSESSKITILIHGTSGHGSQPDKLKECTRGAVKFYLKALQYLDALKEEKKGNFVCTLPVFQAGQRYNVISKTCIIQGTIRSFEEGLAPQVAEKFKQICAELEKEGFETEVVFQPVFPVNSNTKTEAEHILRVGKAVFGENMAGKGKLPFRASEDFSFYTQNKPGAFFFLSSTKKGQAETSPMLHNSNFDFNDDLIDRAAVFWKELALDRLTN